MNEFEYLSDEELNKLIFEAEADLVQAPPGLLDSIMAEVDSGSEKAKPPMKTKEQKILEYRRFRRQVIISMAASIAASLILPMALSFMPEMPKRERPIETKEELMAKREVITKEEYTKRTSLDWLGGWINETEEKE